MKKTLRLISLLSVAFLLVACTNKANKEVTNESVVSEVSSVESSSMESESTESMASTESDASVESSESMKEESNTEEPDADSIVFKLYLTGEDEPFAEYIVKDADGKNVLDTMESINDLEFNFNEEEGVIDVIEGHENNYAEGTTWAYLLNGQYAELGVVSQQLSAGDEISWYYGHADEIPMNLVPAE